MTFIFQKQNQKLFSSNEISSPSYKVFYGILITKEIQTEEI
jgi:hypothetical protein